MAWPSTYLMISSFASAISAFVSALWAAKSALSSAAKAAISPRKGLSQVFDDFVRVQGRHIHREALLPALLQYQCFDAAAKAVCCAGEASFWYFACHSLYGMP